MTQEKEDTDLELYGTSPGVVVFFMIIITLIVALGILPMSVILFFGEMDLGHNFMLYDLNFAYSPTFLVPFTITYIPYIWKIRRYYRGDCTRYSVIWVSMLCAILPSIYALVVIGILNPTQNWLIISPIYLPFIAGLIFMFKIPGPEMTSPWRGDLGDNSWWKPKRPDWWYRMFPTSEEDGKNEPESKIESVETE